MCKHILSDLKKLQLLFKVLYTNEPPTQQETLTLFLFFKISALAWSERPSWRLRFPTCSSTVARTKIRVQQKNKLNFYVYCKQICRLFTKKKKNRNYTLSWAAFVILFKLTGVDTTGVDVETNADDGRGQRRPNATSERTPTSPLGFGLMFFFFSRESRLMLKKTYNDSVSSKKNSH